VPSDDRVALKLSKLKSLAGEPDSIKDVLSRDLLRRHSIATFRSNAKKIQKNLKDRRDEMSNELRKIGVWKIPRTQTPRFAELSSFIKTNPDPVSLSNYIQFLNGRLEAERASSTASTRVNDELTEFLKNATAHRDTKSYSESYFAGIKRYIEDCVDGEEKKELTELLRQTRQAVMDAFPTLSKPTAELAPEPSAQGSGSDH
jgi:hypothetical protein